MKLKLLITALLIAPSARVTCSEQAPINPEDMEMFIPAVLASKNATKTPQLIAAAKSSLLTYNDELVNGTPQLTILTKLKDSQAATDDRAEFAKVVAVCEVTSRGTGIHKLDNGLDRYKKEFHDISKLFGDTPELFAVDLHYNEKDATKPTITFRMTSKDKHELHKLNDEQRAYIKYLYTASHKEPSIEISQAQLETHISLPTSMQQALEKNYTIPLIEERRKKQRIIAAQFIFGRTIETGLHYFDRFVMPTNDFETAYTVRNWFFPQF